MLLQEETSNSNTGGSTTSDAEKQLRGLAQAQGIFNFEYDKFASKFAANLPLSKAGIKNIIDATSKLEDLSYTLTQETLGQTRVIGKAIQETMAQAAFDSAQYGITLDDQMSVFKEINTIMQRNTMLTSEQQTSMALLANNAGVAAGDVATMVEAFDTIGVNTDDAIANISKMQQEARSYGINVGQFMKNIGSNVKLLNSYNFKNGVEGFTKMVAKAQALRIDFNKTVSLADSLLSPETAIETAAGFQMLGGAVGDLGDPFKLLYMAQNDVEGLQDQILGMAESATVFNEKTGKFDIPVTEMYRLREAAKLTGMDYQELADTAVKSAERTKKLDLLAGSGLDDDTKELIANLGEIKDGSVKIKLPGSDELVDATQLGNENMKGELEKLKQIQEDAKLSDKDIALQQLSSSRKLNAVLEAQVLALGPLIGTNTDAIMDVIDAAGAGGEATSESIRNAFNPENMKNFGDGLTGAIQTGFEGKEEMADFRTAGGKILKDINSGVKNFGETFREKMDVDNFFKDSEAFEKLSSSLTKLGLSADMIGESNVGRILGGLSDSLNDFTKDLLTKEQRIEQHTDQRSENDENSVSNQLRKMNKATETTNTESQVQNVSMNENVPTFQVLADMGTTAGQNVMGGDINLNVGGTIDFAIDGRNLPQNISTEELANQIVNNPDFTSKLMSIFTDANNTYSA